MKTAQINRKSNISHFEKYENKPEILSVFKREPRASILRYYKKL